MGSDRTFDEVARALRSRDDADAAVAPAMRSYVLAGERGAGVVILLHGLTASPPAWRAVATALHARGRTVIVPRLLLHGHTDRMTEALRDATADMLVDDIANIVGLTEQLGETVTVAGHSLGATLAIDAVARVDAVSRIIAVAPFLGISKVPYEVQGAVLSLMRRLPNLFLWWDPVARENLMPVHGYPRYPLSALVAGMAIGDAARGHAPHAGSVDLVLNDHETSVSNRTALRLASDWRAAGTSVAVHRLRGLDWSHDIIEPARLPAQQALATLVEIIDADHAPRDREHVIGGVRER